jgi:hypothetical protein
MGTHRAIVRSRQGFVRCLAVLVLSTAMILGLAVAAGVVTAPTGSALPIPTLPTLPGVTTTIPLPIPVPTLPPAPVPTPPVLPGSSQPSKPSQNPPPQPPPTSPPTTAAPAPAPSGSSSANSNPGPSGASTPLQPGSAFSGLASSLMSGGMTPSTAATDDIPPEMLALYQQAAPTCPGLPWTVLAGIGKEETNHGRNVAVSSAGAMGVMQFMPATFAVVGVDGNKDGKIDINNPADSVFSAAHYLCTNGAGDPNRLYGAIYAYNHADWYVQAVLSDAANDREAGRVDIAERQHRRCDGTSPPLRDHARRQEPVPTARTPSLVRRCPGDTGERSDDRVLLLMKQRTIDLVKRRTALVVALAVVLVLGMAALAFRSANASAGGSSSERPATQADVYKSLNDPKRSGLDPKLASQLAALGTQVVKADVTGVGRNAFPNYWAGGDYRPCCQSVVIHAAGARPSGTRAGMVQVIVAWSAQRANNGPSLDNQVETITFGKVGSNWEPVPPQYLSP